MRLQKLEIKGFKSFANDTAIHFNEDVIGIVGPNGSGKSNIVDAIRWVLGEQKSKELRLDQMSSVIFNGTKKRKPSGVAQVSLTFENTKNILPTEYQSVKITRMLYRTGESEYRLNEVPCRLKDITSLFLDTGIGSNSYAIIALGMVDDILSDKDNSRRRMFEQAAGVSKYKVRKRETISKLNSATEDLNRVEDLLYEIDNNLTILEKQAKRAKKYFRYKEEYKSFSIYLAVMKIKGFKDKQVEITRKLTSEEDQYRSCEIQITQLEAKLEADKKKVLTEERELSEQQRSLNSLVGKIRGMESDKKMLAQKLQFVEQNKSKLSDSIQQGKRRIGELEEDVDFYRSNLNYEKHLEDELEQALEQAEFSLKEIRSKHENLKSDLDLIMGDQRKAEQSVFELEKKRAINNNQLDGLRQNLTQSDLEIKNRIDEIQALREKAQNFQIQEDTLKQKIQEVESKEAQRTKNIEGYTKQKEKLQQELAKTNRSLDAKRNEYQLTKSMVENMEGFPESIRFLKQSKKWNTNAPLLTDIVYVKEAYRAAIENFLEDYLNYYVVKNLEEAYRAIDLLKNAQKGKANFFLLDAFEGFKPTSVSLDNENVTEARTLIETDAPYQSLFDYLLDKVFIVSPDHLEATKQVENAVFITPDGGFLKRSRSISGGSVGLFEGNKIGRKKTLEVLEKNIKKIENDVKKLETALKVVTENLQKENAVNYKKELQELNRAFNQLAQEKVSVDTRLENFEQFMQQVEDRKAGDLEKIAAIESENKGIEAHLTEGQEKVEQAKAKISDTDVAFRTIAEQLSKANTQFNDKNIQFIKQQNKVTSIQNDLKYRERELEETTKRIQSEESTLNQSDGEIGQIQKELDEIETSLLDGYERKKVFQNSLSEAEQKYFEARGTINEIENDLRQQQKKRTDAQIIINSLKDKSNEVKFEITSISQRLSIEFEENINQHINQPIPDDLPPQEELQLKVERLKNRLDNYGEINPMAVQAYDEMKERHDNITQQRDDILEAKQSLMDTIKEIEETATSQFLSAFEKARVYFINVFRSLFTADDSCDLILLDPENPLESKIEIVAKPKGKRPQSISQLSGGEKTLTATALLFALYLLKPAPFCIFDEVDAPLDDANINKFNKIIKKFSKDSQFIIVTHNKLTMAAVDTIYGVYMAEQGISAVSAVDFRHFEETGTFEAINS